MEASERLTESLLTVSEIADHVRVNQQTVRNWIDRGELPAIRVGSRRVRVRRDDLETFLEEKGTKTPRATRSDRLRTIEKQLEAITARVERLEREL